MNMLLGKPRAAIAKEIASASTPTQLCKAANGNGVPVVFTHLASPYIIRLWKDKTGKRNYFEASAQLLDSRRDNALLIYGSEREAEMTHRIFAIYGVPLERYQFIISPSGVLIPKQGKPIESPQSARGIELVKGMIEKAKVLLAGGLMRPDCVLDTMKDMQAIAAGMGKKADDFSIMTHRLITRDVSDIITSEKTKT